PCLLPVPPPPTSQLFPYTTLFRSGFPASSLRRMLNRPRIRRFLHRSLPLRTVRCGVAASHAANSWHSEFSAAFRSNREPFFVRFRQPFHAAAVLNGGLYGYSQFLRPRGRP